MAIAKSSNAQQIGQAAIAFERLRTGHSPKSVTVVLSDNSIVITLHGTLSLAEQALAQSLDGAAQLHEFHRLLFSTSSDSMRKEIMRITGEVVREATAEVELVTGAVMGVFASGTSVQVYLLAQRVPTETWSGN